MTEDEIITFVSGLPGVVVVTASAEGGAPGVAWGDSFFFHDPDGTKPAARMRPFATLVIQDYPDFDTVSDLSRPGVFRLNVDVGRVRFEELFGYPPADHESRSAGVDYTAADRVFPHPVYGTQAWASIVCPGAETAELARTLLTEAHERAVVRYAHLR